MRLHDEVRTLRDECIRTRRELHRIPETAFEEVKTQRYILDRLEKLKPDKLITLAKTGVKAVFYAEAPDMTIAFRADIDALDRNEENKCDYISTHPGKMHACGHDGHMTILLLLAELVSKNRDRLTNNIVLLFQPGEEGHAGATVMIEDGALSNPTVDRIYGMHVWPTVQKGKIGIRWGTMMAQTSEFDVIVRGKSAHGASPQMGVDAIVAAAELVTLVQTVITRNIDPHQDALLTIGRIEGGTARNIIADEVKLCGTFRVFSSEVYEQLVEHLLAVSKGLETATGANFEYRELLRYPCIDNPRELVEELYTYLDDMNDTELIEPVMAAEDFAFYQQEIPGLFMFLGVEGGKNTHPLHNCKFDFDEEELLNGVEMFYRLLKLR